MVVDPAAWAAWREGTWREAGGWLATLAVLAVALGVAYLAATLFGVSFALGAFVAGMVLALINRIPRTGDVFSHDGWVVEIADMDAMRIDRLIVTAPAAEN